MSEPITCPACGILLQNIQDLLIHNERSSEPEHTHAFIVPVKWEYGYDWDTNEWGKVEVGKATSKRVTKLKCSSCSEIEEVKL